MNWSSFLGQGMQSYADTRQKQQQLNQPGEWKPRTMGEYIKMNKLKNAPSSWDIEKEARIRASSMLNDNPSLQIKAFDDPTIITSLIENEKKRLGNIYSPQPNQQSMNTPIDDSTANPYGQNFSGSTNLATRPPQPQPNITGKEQWLPYAGMSNVRMDRSPNAPQMPPQAPPQPQQQPMAQSMPQPTPTAPQQGMGARIGQLGGAVGRGFNTFRGQEPQGQKSPYPEYPNAYFENGVWKVKQDGKTYRIE